jgi:hypothetical protein
VRKRLCLSLKKVKNSSSVEGFFLLLNVFLSHGNAEIPTFQLFLACILSQRHICSIEISKKFLTGIYSGRSIYCIAPAKRIASRRFFANFLHREKKISFFHLLPTGIGHFINIINSK